MFLKLLVLAAVLHPAIALAQSAPPAAAIPPTPAAKPATTATAPPPAAEAPAAKPAPAPSPAAATTPPPPANTAATAPAAAVPATTTTTAATAPVPAPAGPAEVKQLRDLFGSGVWRCDGTSTPPGAASHPVRGAATVKANSNDGWVVTNYKERKTKTNKSPHAVTEHFTYDTATKNYVRLAMDPMGGWSVMTAITAEPNKLAFQGDTLVAGKRLPGKITYTKSDKQLKVEVDLAASNGQLARAAEITCRQ